MGNVLAASPASVFRPSRTLRSTGLRSRADPEACLSHLRGKVYNRLYAQWRNRGRDSAASAAFVLFASIILYIAERPRRTLLILSAPLPKGAMIDTGLLDQPVKRCAAYT